MEIVYRAQGVAFSSREVASDYIDIYAPIELTKQVLFPESGIRKEGERVYSSLEEYEKSNPQACIQRMRTERCIFKNEESDSVALPFYMGYSVDDTPFMTDRLTMQEAYDLTRCAEKQIEEGNVDTTNKNLKLTVVVPNGDVYTSSYNLKVGEYEQLRAIVDNNLTKVAKINEKIQQAMEKYGVKDAELDNENAKYQEFQEKYVKKIEKWHDLHLHGTLKDQENETLAEMLENYSNHEKE